MERRLPSPAMAAYETTITTDDGQMGTFVVHPDGAGPYPVVLFLMDAPGKRPLLHAMATTLASHGYYVMLPNLYYRTTPAFELDFASQESFARMGELMRGVGNRMVGRDAAALFAHADTDPVADADRAGTLGYCMSGPFSIWVAAEHPARVRAAASFYGVRLVSTGTDSPHLRLAELAAAGTELYVACAEHDDWVPLSMVDEFEAAMIAAGVAGRLERFWGCHHGFAFDDRPAYDAEADRRHWDAVLHLFGRTLAGTDAT